MSTLETEKGSFLWEVNYSRYHKEAADYLMKPGAAGKLIREASKFRIEMIRIERARTDLFSLIRSVQEEAGADGMSFPDYMLSLPLPDSDRKLIEKYICRWELLHLLEVAFKTRMKEKHAAIAYDLVITGMREEDAAEKYGVSVRTVRRVRQKGVEAAEEELLARKAILPELMQK